MEDRVHVHQFFKVPELNENFQDNQFYRKVKTYVNSLASMEDSDFTNLFTGKKSNDIVLCLDDNQTVHDEFLGARVSWTNEVGKGNGKGCSRTFVLRIKKKDKRRILRPYLQHIHTVSDEIEQRRREVKLYMNTQFDHQTNGRWRSIPFTHPSTLDTIAMDSDLKNKVKSDLESFLKSKQYYHRLGRVWKRSYLLYGPSGTGKSSFVAAMAKFLSYDVYDVDLSRVSDNSDLTMLFITDDEQINRYEKVLVFTMNTKEQIDPAILRPGRIDLFRAQGPQVVSASREEVFQSGATLSTAEIGEIMISNRGSPSRALKSVITALQANGDARAASKVVGRRRSESASSRVSSEESVEMGGFKDSSPSGERIT
ncbi:P-loop containing nucleoside triphosphate hydrolases superfamily protein [Actinidia rufa]|uniref:P-loop containing nucleoside triphosphate hydrolases superfamily protein n=1 Tax=Actinidia rufa TaxID=165716 RepID=A0A7J0F4K7_9ERIC|nr:P-loop containing nucleoside triphosphate hydrolases superfamily protein [Actinidia rufa]